MGCARYMASLSLTLAVSGASIAGAAPSTGQELAIDPGRVILMDVVRTGQKLVAVGERGVIMSSSADAKTWQVRRVATTRTLTSVAFGDENVGVAVGHGATLLRTGDGGQTWVKVDAADVGGDSLLGVTALGGSVFVAYGAFGLYLETHDGGKSWTRRTLDLRNPGGKVATAAADKDETGNEDFDRHIAKVLNVGKDLLLVGESGTLARSTDRGETWTKIPTPYRGSYFGALFTPRNTLLVFGMRGNVFRSTDSGTTWAPVELNTKNGLNGGVLLSDGRIVLVGNNGLVAVSEDDGITFSNSIAAGGRDIAQAGQAADGTVVAVGAAGVRDIALAARKN